jgi:hypothetical protein
MTIASRRLGVAKWKFTELPVKSKKGCMVENCKKYADYEGRLQKRDGLFRFVVYVCAWHKLLSSKPALQRKI